MVVDRKGIYETDFGWFISTIILSATFSGVVSIKDFLPSHMSVSTGPRYIVEK